MAVAIKRIVNAGLNTVEAAGPWTCFCGKDIDDFYSHSASQLTCNGGHSLRVMVDKPSPLKMSLLFFAVTSNVATKWRVELKKRAEKLILTALLKTAASQLTDVTFAESTS
jgi:hypothetical protein